jgi:hypothetical protein
MDRYTSQVQVRRALERADYPARRPVVIPEWRRRRLALQAQYGRPFAVSVATGGSVEL